MDMWGWVYREIGQLRRNGHEQLASYMDRLPLDAVSGKHDRLDQYADDAIALARSADLPWVEIFLRHWRLQSTVLFRQRPRHMIHEAVSLLEFAHRPENRDCPQSVCVVQDLANCYGVFDGPGFSDDRIAVCRENLARIDVSWPCFECIGAELARALLDADRVDECVAFLDKCDRDLVDARRAGRSTELLLVRILAHARRGDFDLAREYAKAERPDRKSFDDQLKTLRALIESYAGNHREAMNVLPRFATIESSSSCHYHWAEAVFGARRHDPTLVKVEDMARISAIAIQAEDRGAYRQALVINGWLASLDREQGFDAEAADRVAAMRRVRVHLNKDLGADALIASLSLDSGTPFPLT